MTWPEGAILYRQVGEDNVLCSLVCRHRLNIYKTVELAKIVGARVHDNGYVKQSTHLVEDTDGRLYHQHISVDYGMNTSFLRLDDDTSWRPYVPTIPFELADGTIITELGA